MMTDKPTDKQLSYIIRLLGAPARRPDDAYHAIARTMRMSTTAARGRATRQDASETIDRLKGG